MLAKSSRCLIIIQPPVLFPRYTSFSRNSCHEATIIQMRTAPQTRCDPRFLLPVTLPSLSLSLSTVPHISRLVDLYRSLRYSAVYDSGQAALRSAGSKTCCHEAPGGACAREGASGRDKRDGQWGGKGMESHACRHGNVSGSWLMSAESAETLLLPAWVSSGETGAETESPSPSPGPGGTSGARRAL